jgi:hypothetical protein
MAEPVTDPVLEYLFAAGNGHPCPSGTALLRAFAERHPSDFSFLQSTDLTDLRNSAFTGIPEWDAFADHYSTCGLCDG